MLTQFDYVWSVKDAQDNVFTELDIRVFGEYQEPFIDGAPITVKDAKALFHKHGAWIEADLPEDLKRLCMRDLSSDHDLQVEWAQEIAGDAEQEESEARDVARAGSRED